MSTYEWKKIIGIKTENKKKYNTNKIMAKRMSIPFYYLPEIIINASNDAHQKY